MITMLRVRPRQVGDEWFGRHPPGRELSADEEETGPLRWQWSRRQERSGVYTWRRVAASKAVNGTWRKLDAHWTVVDVLPVRHT